LRLQILTASILTTVMRLRQFLVALPLLLAFSTAKAEDACPVTTPPNSSFVPPVPYRPNPYPGSFWYGTAALWTSLPVEGAWHFERSTGEGYENKLFLWQEGWDWRKEPYPPGPDITVVLERLDANTPSTTSHGGTNALFDDSWAMLTGIHFPSEGCWEITVFHRSDKLTFVLSIEASE
jgi:hypothetical protein